LSGIVLTASLKAHSASVCNVTEPSKNFCIQFCEASNWPKNTLKLYSNLTKKKHFSSLLRNYFLILFRKEIAVYCEGHNKHSVEETLLFMLQQTVNIVTSVFLEVKCPIFVVVCNKQTISSSVFVFFFSYFLVATLSSVYSVKKALRCNIFPVGPAFESIVNNTYFVFSLRPLVRLSLTHATERQIALFDTCHRATNCSL